METRPDHVHSINEVQGLLECPVCMNNMSSPIYQCSNGHTVCSPCKARVHNSCPICRYELGAIRCLALEKAAKTFRTYQNSGFTDISLLHNKLKHEKSCKKRPYNCPYAGAECSVTGNIPWLLLHLRKEHNVDMHNGCTFNHKYVKSNAQEVDHATWMLSLFNCFGQQFCLHFEAFHMRKAPVYMAFLQFMGEEEEAREFSYTLEVGGNGRKLTWQGVPRSIRYSHEKIRESQDGLIIPRNLALFFSGGSCQELQLRVSGRVWREK